MRENSIFSRAYNIKKYISIGKTAIQDTLTYRFNYFMTLLTQFIFLLTLFFLWEIIFYSKNSLAGYTWQEMKAYLFIAFLSNCLLSWYSERKISLKIIDGQVAMDLLKPLDFHKAQLAESMGSAAVEGGIGGVLAGLFVVLSSGLYIPDVLSLSLFFISLIFAFFIKFGIVYLTGLVCFWTSNSLGVTWSRIFITNFFSGALVPLAFFPLWLQQVSYFLPFHGIVYIPASIYLNKIKGMEIGGMLCLQLFWIAALWVLGNLLWKKAVKKLTIAGG